MSTKPGITYMPLPSISKSKSRGSRLACCGQPGQPAWRTWVMRLPSMTMSIGLSGGPPVPSISVTPRMTIFLNGPCAFARLAGGRGRVARRPRAWRWAPARPAPPGGPARRGVGAGRGRQGHGRQSGGDAERMTCLHGWKASEDGDGTSEFYRQHLLLTQPPRSLRTQPPHERLIRGVPASVYNAPRPRAAQPCTAAEETSWVFNESGGTWPWRCSSSNSRRPPPRSHKLAGTRRRPCCLALRSRLSRGARSQDRDECRG